MRLIGSQNFIQQRCRLRLTADQVVSLREPRMPSSEEGLTRSPMIVGVERRAVPCRPVAPHSPTRTKAGRHWGRTARRVERSQRRPAYYDFQCCFGSARQAARFEYWNPSPTPFFRRLRLRLDF